MKQKSSYRIKLMLVGIVAAVVLGGETAKADFTFGEPVNLGPPVNSSRRDNTPSISADGLELYFASNRPGGYGNYDLWVTTRSTTDDPWGTPTNLGPIVNSSDLEVSPDISADGLSLYFDAGPVSRRDIWVTERAVKDQPWGTPVKLGPNVNRATWQFCPSISPDGLVLFFDSDRSGGLGDWDLWISQRPTLEDHWEPAINLGSPVNSSYQDDAADISIDGRAMFFQSNRPGGYGDQDLYVTTRPTIYSNWSNPINLGPNINTSYSESDVSVSADGSMLYFSEYPNPRPGGVGDLDLWQVPIIPIVDFNGDGIVDSADMCIMVDHWGENYPLCDIGPTPLGDGIVDVQDLVVLAEHMCGYRRPIAHWTLDEREGNTAYDKVGENNASVYGDALWQPAGGMFGGALELDGIDDYASTDFVLNPANNRFSVFVWIKGGAPGQVILSQIGGANWLGIDPSEGKLMTGLKPPTVRSPSPPLVSETMTTDSNWHRIGFVWDGIYRTLYVDGVVVAQDIQDSLESSSNGLYIGAGKDMQPGTYFSGLIDDIRIYNQALSVEEIATLAQ